MTLDKTKYSVLYDYIYSNMIMRQKAELKISRPERAKLLSVFHDICLCLFGTAILHTTSTSSIDESKVIVNGKPNYPYLNSLLTKAGNPINLEVFDPDYGKKIPPPRKAAPTPPRPAPIPPPRRAAPPSQREEPPIPPPRRPAPPPPRRPAPLPPREEPPIPPPRRPAPVAPPRIDVILKDNGVELVNGKLTSKDFKKLALKYHPDKGGDVKIFQMINNLRFGSRKKKRKSYKKSYKKSFKKSFKKSGKKSGKKSCKKSGKKSGKKSCKKSFKKSGKKSCRRYSRK